MAQIFHPSSNTISKLSIVGAVLGVLVLGAAGYASNIVYGWKYYIPIEQPVQFSHRHHVGDDGIDCRYCHTSVETSAFAGMPSTQTCMTCHSQIWSDSPELQPVRASYISGQPIRWNRVHDMPDHVYFNHSIHIKKGVGCETCHGRVDEKPLMFKSKTMTMSWCLECHREPEKFLRPREHVFDMGWRPGMTKTELPASMKIMPATVSAEARAAAAGHDGAASATHGQAASGSEAAAGSPTTAAHAPGATHAEEAGNQESQTQMGLRLKEEYKVRTARELTDCGVCHR